MDNCGTTENPDNGAGLARTRDPRSLVAEVIGHSPKCEIPCLGVPRIRIVVFGGLYWVPPIIPYLWKLPLRAFQDVLDLSDLRCWVQGSNDFGFKLTSFTELAVEV